MMYEQLLHKTIEEEAAGANERRVRQGWLLVAGMRRVLNGCDMCG